MTRVQIGIFNTGVNGTGGFDPNVSANLGARNVNLGDTSSGIVLVGIVDNLTDTDRATEFTGDGGPFYFLSNNFNFVDTVTVVKGASTYKFGGDFRVRQNSNFDGGRNGGTKGVTCPTASPRQRTVACSGPSQRSVSIFALKLQ